jgi:threonine/homoserine/homoserine lactone efflux protein
MLLTLLQSGASLGLFAGALPGPLQSYIINATLLLGWRKSIVTIFAPLIIDIPFILTILFVMSQFPEKVIQGLQVIGGLYILWIAREAWQHYRAGAILGGDQSQTAARNALLRAVLMGYLSPGPYVFWGTITGPLLVEALDTSLAHGVAFLVSFYGIFISILALIVYTFNRARALDERIARKTLLITIVALVAFGGQLIAKSAIALI